MAYSTRRRAVNALQFVINSIAFFFRFKQRSVFVLSSFPPSIAPHAFDFLPCFNTLSVYLASVASVRCRCSFGAGGGGASFRMGKCTARMAKVHRMERQPSRAVFPFARNFLIKFSTFASLTSSFVVRIDFAGNLIAIDADESGECHERAAIQNFIFSALLRLMERVNRFIGSLNVYKY